MHCSPPKKADMMRAALPSAVLPSTTSTGCIHAHTCRWRPWDQLAVGGGWVAVLDSIVQAFFFLHEKDHPNVAVAVARRKTSLLLLR